ncbi:MAG: glycoside hydrolase family 2 TIM barrel-domain containing protein [Ekhidna sp.]
MRKFNRVLVISFFIFFGCDTSEKLTRSDLNDHWEFTQDGKDTWRKATVPGVVHTDLMANNMIPHPWIGTNELKVLWVENENWIYRKSFTLQKAELDRDAIDLVFEGLDTYADVTLNGKLILSADNMFRRWRTNVKDLLKAGENELQVKFSSPLKVNLPRLDTLGYELPAPNETVERKVSPFTRKAPYHFGWDWGLRLVTSGIWRPVYLESYDVARIENVQLAQKSLSDRVAKLEAVISIDAASASVIDLLVMDIKVQAKVTKGINEVIVPLEIVNPKRWWSNGWGEQNMYEIPVTLTQEGIHLDEEVAKIGLRTVELIQEADSIGESFYFIINGQPLFARGANYIPQSHFLPSVKDEDYEKLIKDASDIGMNMLRVWGGGIYENDRFYELCDEHGILVWQDFMFACSMYPGDSAFIENVEREVIDNVKRLRNHPSIVLWNGNNEVDVAWNNWGWQKQFKFSAQDSTKIWNDYVYLFRDRIPTLLGQLDDRPYTTTSPLSNWGRPENYNYASMHYWGVWHGPDDFDGYRKNVGRFMSEYGFQSFPSMETIAYFADSSEWRLDSDVMKHHQKSYIGNGMIAEQSRKYFGEATSFEDFVLKSQQTQAKAMQIAIDAHRLKRGHCWGTLFWQLNDCWPGPSWSAVDVFGRKKVLYEELTSLYAPVALIPHWEADQLVISLVNDSLDKIEGTMELTLLDTSGEETNLSLPVSSDKNSLVEVHRITRSKNFQNGVVKLILDEKISVIRTF